ncbi:MAG: insulinase family protein [Oligoflexia bacterium]|nr:insulinase family protein [Oligoflexia bacterium]
MPVVAQPAPLAVPVPQRFSLSDGTPVWLVTRPDLPLIHLSLTIGHGLLAAPDPASLALGSTLFDEGTSTRDALAWSDAVDAEGAEISLLLTAGAARVEVDSLAGHQARTLDLAMEALLHPALPRRALRRARHAAVIDARDAWIAPARLHDLAVQRTLYGPGHPLGRVVGAPELRRVTRGRAMRAWQAMLIGGRPALVVVGDTTMAAIRPALEQAMGKLGEWKASHPTLVPPPSLEPMNLPPPAAGPRHVLVDQPGVQRAFVSVLLPVPGLGDPDQPALDLLSRALAAEFDSRLSHALREERGWTYAVTGTLRLWPGHGVLEVRCAVDARVTPAAMVLIDRELHELVAKPPTGVELARAKAAVRRDVASFLLSDRALAGTLAARQGWGLPPQAAAAEAAAAAQVTAAQIGDVAARDLPVDGAIWVITGDRRTIEPLLDAAGIPLDAIRSGRSVVDGIPPLAL